MQRTAYYYMNAEERREYHRQKNREYEERKAVLTGRSIRKQDPQSHPSLMTREERLAYNRECLRRHKERQKIQQ